MDGRRDQYGIYTGRSGHLGTGARWHCFHPASRTCSITTKLERIKGKFLLTLPRRQLIQYPQGGMFMEYSIQELARLSGVTTRTLR